MPSLSFRRSAPTSASGSRLLEGVIVAAVAVVVVCATLATTFAGMAP
jgi:hypothetical protein